MGILIFENFKYMLLLLCSPHLFLPLYRLIFPLHSLFVNLLFNLFLNLLLIRRVNLHTHLPLSLPDIHTIDHLVFPLFNLYLILPPSRPGNHQVVPLVSHLVNLYVILVISHRYSLLLFPLSPPLSRLVLPPLLLDSPLPILLSPRLSLLLFPLIPPRSRLSSLSPVPRPCPRDIPSTRKSPIDSAKV